jgi:4-hydroxy-tetrahydrodipicolinate synthase
MARSGAVMTAMVTPFAADGSFDAGAAAALAQWLIEQGNDGLVLSGTTGESPTLTDDEKIALWRAVRSAVDVPLIAGSTTNDTRHSVRMTKAAADLGMDGILAVTPYYNRPSQAGLEAHFRAVAEVSNLPVLLYDIPVRTGRKIATETILRLAEDVPTIAGVKDAAGNPAETARLIEAAPEGFEVYSGDDSLNLAFLAVGAVGVISVAAHWSAGLHRELVDAVMKGDMDTARAVNDQLLWSYEFETSDDAPNPVPAKAMLRIMGHAVGECRLPMGPTPEGLEDEARELAAELDLLISA